MKTSTKKICAYIFCIAAVGLFIAYIAGQENLLLSAWVAVMIGVLFGENAEAEKSE